MIEEEIKARQTNQEQSKKVSSGQDGAGVTVLDAVSGLLGSKKIPPLDAVQMLALLHYLFKAANPPLRFQIAEVVYRYDHDHPNAHDLFLACTLPSAEKAVRRKAEKLFVHPWDWQVELMYDGAVAAAIEMFQLNPPVSSIPNAFPCYVVRGLSPPEKPIKSPLNHEKGLSARSRPRKAYRKGRKPKRKLWLPFGKGRASPPNSPERVSAATLSFAASGWAAGTRRSRWKRMQLKKMAGW